MSLHRRKNRKKSSSENKDKSQAFPKPIYTIQPIPESKKRMDEWRKKNKKK